MNDYFRNFQRDPEKERAANRFRKHIQTPHRPNRRVVRRCCVFCSYAESAQRPSEAHHPDYSKWWLVVWVCPQHHRMVDHGSLKVLKRHLFDYSSLLNVRPKQWKENQLKQEDGSVPF